MPQAAATLIAALALACLPLGRGTSPLPSLGAALFPVPGALPALDVSLSDDDDETAPELKIRASDTGGFAVGDELARQTVSFRIFPDDAPASPGHVTFSLGARGPPHPRTFDLWRQGWLA
jgi:hypothetical protein